MTEKSEKNGSWLKTFTTVVALFSVGWASASTIAWMDVKRIDNQGTQKSQEEYRQLSERMTKVETEMHVTLDSINSHLTSIDGALQKHVDREARTALSNGSTRNGG